MYSVEDIVVSVIKPVLKTGTDVSTLKSSQVETLHVFHILSVAYISQE